MAALFAHSLGYLLFPKHARINPAVAKPQHPRAARIRNRLELRFHWAQCVTNLVTTFPGRC